MLSLAVGLLLAVPAPAPGRPFAEERLLLDRRLETLRRILPDGPVPSADTTHLRGLAEGARLGRVEIEARPPTQSAYPPGINRTMTVSGGRRTGSWGAIPLHRLR